MTKGGLQQVECLFLHYFKSYCEHMRLIGLLINLRGSMVNFIFFYSFGGGLMYKCRIKICRSIKNVMLCLEWETYLLLPFLAPGSKDKIHIFSSREKIIRFLCNYNKLWFCLLQDPQYTMYGGQEQSRSLDYYTAEQSWPNRIPGTWMSYNQELMT